MTPLTKCANPHCDMVTCSRFCATCDMIFHAAVANPAAAAWAAAEGGACRLCIDKRNISELKSKEVKDAS
jgi:hypothetical protein